MEKQSLTYVAVKVLGIIGNLKKQLPTIESVIDENGRLTFSESDLAGKATLTFTSDREPYILLAERNFDDILDYLKDLCGGGLIVPKKSLEGTFCYAESLEDKRRSNLRQILGY